MLTNHRGMTLIEIMIVVSIIAVLAALAVAAHAHARKRSQAILCIQYRHAVESAEARLALQTGRHSASLQELEDDGYLKVVRWCPSGGDFTWVSYPEDSSLYRSTVACSVHDPDAAPEGG